MKKQVRIKFFVIGTSYKISGYTERTFVYLGKDTNQKHIFFSSGPESLRVELSDSELKGTSIYLDTDPSAV